MDDFALKDDDKEEDEDIEEMDVDVEILKKAERKLGKKKIDDDIPKIFDVHTPNEALILDEDDELPITADEDLLADEPDDFAEDDDELTEGYFSGGADPDLEDAAF